MILDELNRRLLWSHCLSHRITGSDSPVKVVDACCGIQSQNFPESLSSFWARIEGFQNNGVLSQLKPGGGLVRTRAVRSTMHIIPSKDYYTYVLGGAGERMLNWLDTTAKQRNYPPREERIKRLYNPVLQEIKGRSVTQEAIGALVSAKARILGLKGGIWTGIGESRFWASSSPPARKVREACTCELTIGFLESRNHLTIIRAESICYADSLHGTDLSQKRISCIGPTSTGNNLTRLWPIFPVR
jgi:hypothetical protein